MAPAAPEEGNSGWSSLIGQMNRPLPRAMLSAIPLGSARASRALFGALAE